MDPVLIWTALALAVGAAIAAFITRRGARTRVDAVLAELGEEQKKVEAALAERDAALGKHSDVDATRQALETQMLRETGALETKLARMETLLDGEKGKAEDGRKTLQEAQEQMVALAAKTAVAATAESGQALMQSFEERMKTATTSADADLAKRQKSVEESVRPVAEALTRMETTLQRVDEDRRKSHVVLTESLRAVGETQRELRTETGTLSRALRQPHTRGRWGEMHLRRLVEFAGMSGHCDFVEQSSVEDDGRLLRPDMVVTLPGEKDVVVDSKAPLAAYMDACEATDDTQRTHRMSTYARGMRTHVKKLASKDYAAQFPSAPDFVVLYLPGEHFLGAACEADPDLIEYAVGLGVLIATPTTLIVLLKTIAHAWQQEKVSLQAQAIAEQGRLLYDRVCKYLEYTDLVSKRLNSAVDAQNKAVASLERMVLPVARKFPELGAVAANKTLTPARTVDSNARDIQARELSVRSELPVVDDRGSAACDDLNEAA